MHLGRLGEEIVWHTIGKPKKHPGREERQKRLLNDDGDPICILLSAIGNGTGQSASLSLHRHTCVYALSKDTKRDGTAQLAEPREGTSGVVQVSWR